MLLNTTATGATVPSFAAQQTFATGSDPTPWRRRTSTATASLTSSSPTTGHQRERAAEHDRAWSHHGNLRHPADLLLRGSRFSSVAAADINGDGKPDLIVANANSNDG